MHVGSPMFKEIREGVGVELAETALEWRLPHHAVHVLEDKRLRPSLPVPVVVMRYQVLADQVGPNLAFAYLTYHGAALFPYQLLRLLLLGQINIIETIKPMEDTVLSNKYELTFLYLLLMALREVARMALVRILFLRPRSCPGHWLVLLKWSSDLMCLS